MPKCIEIMLSSTENTESGYTHVMYELISLFYNGNLGVQEICSYVGTWAESSSSMDLSGGTGLLLGLLY